MDELQELNHLVNSYNRVEVEQTERLTRIFQIVNGRKGTSKLEFSNGRMWVNWVKNPNYPAFVNSMESRITHFDPGMDK